MSFDPISINQNRQLNLQKLLLYVSVSDNDPPLIDSSQQTKNHLATEMRMYFNDEQLVISEEGFKGEGYLASGEFEERVGEVFEEFLYSFEDSKSWGFLEWLEFWVGNSGNLRVEYRVYDEAVGKSVESYLENCFRVVSRNVFQVTNQKASKRASKHSQSSTANNLLRNKDNCEQYESKTEASKTSIRQQNLSKSPNPKLTLSRGNSHKKHPEQDQPQDAFNYYLRKYFEHYSKRSANTVKTQEFQKLQHFYTTLNLTKFMAYCREVGLLRVDKSVTVKYVQGLFVRGQDERHVMGFEGFARVVGEILLKVYKEPSIVESQGYVLIGVKNRENFVEKMRKIGVSVPLKKVVFSRPQNSKKETIDLGEKAKMEGEKKGNRKQQEKENDSKKTNAKNGGYEYAYELAWKRIHDPKPSQQKIEPLPLLLPHIGGGKSKNKPGSNIEELLELDSEEDPYLRRFKGTGKDESRRDYSKKKESGMDEGGGGVIARMERRMENVVKRIR